MTIRAYESKDIDKMIEIWNEVVEEGAAFPQTDLLNRETGAVFFSNQTYCGVAVDNFSQEVCGLYILHPNNIGRCGHIGNASYAVSSARRGQHIGEKLVTDSLVQAKKHGFRLMQFNAVVESNQAARRLYERLGFVQLGTIPQGFQCKNGVLENICLYYKLL